MGKEIRRENQIEEGYICIHKYNLNVTIEEQLFKNNDRNSIESTVQSVAESAIESDESDDSPFEMCSFCLGYQQDCKYYRSVLKYFENKK